MATHCRVLNLCLIAFSVLFASTNSANTSGFTIIGGQLYTAGLGIVDAPQPFTPEGGDFLQVAIDISGNGKLPQPYFGSDLVTGFQNITMFLFSFATGLNLTISNGTASGWRTDSPEDQEFQCGGTTTQGFANAGCQEIMTQESGSTVKHVNWVWPDCLIGNGGNQFSGGITRGSYNVSIHQQFRINGTGYYTIFNLPIEVTNTIPQRTQLSRQGNRPSCFLLTNILQNQTRQDESVVNPPFQPYLGGSMGFQGTDQGQGGVQTVTVSPDPSTTGAGSGFESGTTTVTITGTGSVATKGPVVLNKASSRLGSSWAGVLALAPIAVSAFML